ncbi:MAG: phosphoribosylaminoimidazolesuccinocarboxamide synthase [Kineosporiaceae bacterium]|nr:phosphoribosylaminoimidazolesuccinocarboxamide synthase [Kineosporiaceae bacterium]
MSADADSPVAEADSPAAGVPGWRHVYSGKVRDLYVPADSADADRVLVVASDRISAYDHVLVTPIPDKGRILTALSLWWFERLAGVVAHHVLTTEVPAAVAGRAMICRRLEMIPVECVARGYLTGSGLAEYVATTSGGEGGRGDRGGQGGQVCGVRLPPGLLDGSRLPEPIFTPATKAPMGEHDENVTYDQVVARVGQPTAARIRELTLTVYATAEKIARDRGILVADTKFEFGVGAGAGDIMLGDEVLTPDSSRFWPADGWQPGRAQPSFDKQFVRDWLTSASSGWDRHGDQAPPPLPEDVVERTRARYVEAYERLTGRRWTN